jgi:hypothetical protein
MDGHSARKSFNFSSFLEPAEEKLSMIEKGALKERL